MPNLPSLEELKRKGIIKMGNDPSLITHFVPIGIPALDAMLGGGLPKGHCVQIYGPESTGKTLTAQFAVAAVQKTDRPLAAYIDLEQTYDEEWWEQSGVDTEKLLVSSPTTAEQAIDVIRALLLAEPDNLGIVVIDSLAAMIPAPEMDEKKSSEDNRQPGLQAKVITLLFHQVMPMLKNKVILMVMNQMRDSIGQASALSSLPGGRAARHYSHIILATRRDDWIIDPTTGGRLGFYMGIVNRKNKLCDTPDGEQVILPFMFGTQFDWTTSYIQDLLDGQIIKRAGPYYKFNDQTIMGMKKLRQYFIDFPDVFDELRALLTAA